MFKKGQPTSRIKVRWSYIACGERIIVITRSNYQDKYKFRVIRSALQ